MGDIPQKYIDRFMQRFKKVDSGCWEWQSYVYDAKWGYGGFFVNGKTHRAHRVSYQIFKGEIPTGLLVCHTCDNPICVNPDHLFLGTDLDNSLDMRHKGRHSNGDRRGSKQGNAKLRDSDVLTIREQYAEGLFNQYELAEKFNVHQAHISGIISRKFWGHI